MNKEFWIEKWDQNQIGFHQVDFNSFLVNHFDEILKGTKNIFVPLCGKSRDILYLSEITNSVLGIELSEKAILEFFLENNLKYTKTSKEDFDVYEAGNITLIRGDIFIIPKQYFEKIDGVYDRACIVALPIDLRTKYVNLISEIPNLERYFLQTLSFDNDLIGPPFNINQDKVFNYFNENFQISLVESNKLIGDDIDVHFGKVQFLKNLIFNLKRRV